MIRLERGELTPTHELLNAQQALAEAASDEAGCEIVKRRAGIAWTSMRPTLSASQNGKCGYCEDYLRPRMTEIDHIRPKKHNRYWWLAYSPANLLATCRTCNNTKKDQWELQPGATPLVARQSPWEVTEPAMLVDPTIEDPSDHVTYIFKGGLWRIAPVTSRGRWTIATLGLDSDTARHESNEFILDAIDPIVQEVEFAKLDLDRDGLAAAIAKLVRFDDPQRRWLQLIRTVIRHVVDGTYRKPVLP